MVAAAVPPTRRKLVYYQDAAGVRDAVKDARGGADAAGRGQASGPLLARVLPSEELGPYRALPRWGGHLSPGATQRDTQPGLQPKL